MLEITKLKKKNKHTITTQEYNVETPKPEKKA